MPNSYSKVLYYVFRFPDPGGPVYSGPARKSVEFAAVVAQIDRMADFHGTGDIFHPLKIAIGTAPDSSGC